MTDRVVVVTDGGTEAAPREALSYEQARDKLAAAMAKRDDSDQAEAEDTAPF